MRRLIILDTLGKILTINLAISSFISISASPVIAEEASLFIQLNDKFCQGKTLVNHQQQEQSQRGIQPTDKKQGWSQWQRWDNFPHEQIQLGVSNTDYGGFMDMEYKCFGEVSRDNDVKKYRLSRPLGLNCIRSYKS